MCANMLWKAKSHTPGFTWSQQALEKEIQAINDTCVMENRRATIGSWKKRGVQNIMLHMPTSVYDCLWKHYVDYTWERSLMNEELMKEGIWREEFRLGAPKSGVPAPGGTVQVGICRGKWQEVYSMTKPALLRLATRLIKFWQEQFPKTTLKETPVSMLQAARFMRLDSSGSEVLFHKYAAYAAFYENWLLPRVHNEFGDKGVALVTTLWDAWDAKLVDALQMATVLRGEATSHDILALHTLTDLHTILAGTQPLGPSSDLKLDKERRALQAWQEREGQINCDKVA